MRFRRAIAISGAAHAGVIAWALIAGLFPSADPEESLQVASVGIVSSAEFDALVSRTPGPAAPAPEAPAAPADPETPDAPPPAAETPPPQPQPRPETPAPPDATAPDSTPDVARLVTAPPTEAAEEAPDAPPSPRPAPRPADRVAQVPAPAPPPLTETAPSVEPPSEPAPEAEPEEPEEPAEEAAPEETTTAEVTEADIPAAAEQPAVETSRAPQTSERPGRRPSRPAPAVAAAEAAAPATPPAAAPADPAPPTFDASAALAEALAGGGSAAQEGPQLSDGQREGFRLAVQACWDLGAVSTDTLRTIIEVRFEMRPDGFPVSSSIRLESSRGGTDTSTQIALDKARQAILGCARDTGGYDLPAESYDDWKDIIITFDPTRR